MAEKIESIIRDSRVIRDIVVGNGTASDIYGVGARSGITKIACYGEKGEMAEVPWFAIYRGDKLTNRVNGKWVIEVHYDG